MGKRKRRMFSSKFAKKFARKYANLKTKLQNFVTTTTEPEKEDVVEEAPKITTKEIDESAVLEPKIKKKSTKKKTYTRKKTKKS